MHNAQPLTEGYAGVPIMFSLSRRDKPHYAARVNTGQRLLRAQDLNLLSGGICYRRER
jgi:hypothetical protein